jgi:low temperature requirement protein LtrA
MKQTDKLCGVSFDKMEEKKVRKFRKKDEKERVARFWFYGHGGPSFVVFVVLQV